MMRTASAAAVFVLTGAVAHAQTPTILQEVPTTVVPLQNPVVQPHEGTVTVIQTLPPGLTGGGITTSPGQQNSFISGSFAPPNMAPTWIKAPGLTEAVTANPGERDKKYGWDAICRARHGGVWLIGMTYNLNGRHHCIYAAAGQVITTADASPLWHAPNAAIRWVSLQGNQVPQSVMLSATEPGQGVPLCRALVGTKMRAGWADRNGCNILSGNHMTGGGLSAYKASTTHNFEIVAVGQLVARPQGGPTAPNASFIDLFSFSLNPGR